MVRQAIRLVIPGLSDTPFLEIQFDPYSPKIPENVKVTTIYRCTGRLLRPTHSTMTTQIEKKSSENTTFKKKKKKKRKEKQGRHFDLVDLRY